MVYSNEGLNTLSQTYHELYNHRLIRGNYRLKERPTLINNWKQRILILTKKNHEYCR